MNGTTELFCSIDDFWNNYKSYWYKKQLIHKSSRGPSCSLSISEIMTIIILLHQSNYRTFKYFYLFLYNYHRKEFPKMPCYSRFVALKKSAFIPLFFYLQHCKGKTTGISFIDSTPIKVCHIKRSNSNKVLRE